MDNLPEYIEGMDAREAFELGKQVLHDMAEALVTENTTPRLTLTVDSATLIWFDEKSHAVRTLDIYIFQSESVSVFSKVEDAYHQPTLPESMDRNLWKKQIPRYQQKNEPPS